MRDQTKTRPFPWKCRMCGKKSVNPVPVDYQTEMDHDGRSYSFTVPQLLVHECNECHNRTLPDESLDTVMLALRNEAGLLSPAKIRDLRKQLGLTQDQLANYLQVATETVSRWETGRQIQQRAMDLLLRVFFEMPEVRQRLAGNSVAAPTLHVTSYATMYLPPLEQPEQTHFDSGFSAGANIDVEELLADL